MACISMAALGSSSALHLPSFSPSPDSLKVSSVSLYSKTISASSFKPSEKSVFVQNYQNDSKNPKTKNWNLHASSSDSTSPQEYEGEVAPTEEGEGEEEAEGEGEEETVEPIALLPVDAESLEESRPDSSSSSDSEVSDLKQALVDSLYGTERGFRASSETRAEVAELIAQLEAVNPTPSVTDSVGNLNGRWILAYTSFSELYPLLAAGNLPFVTVGDISQSINTSAGVLSNTVIFSGPIASIAFTTEASFEVRSPKRIQVKFEEGAISSPEIFETIEVPKSVDVFGRTLDISQFEGILKPLQDVATTVVRTISGAPPLKFPIGGGQAQSWLLTTFLDEDLRISRGDGGGVFVLIKAGSPLLI